MIKRGFSIGKLICYIVLVIWAVITIYPLIYTFLTSFKTQTSMYTNMFGLPETWHFENYAGLEPRKKDQSIADENIGML